MTASSHMLVVGGQRSGKSRFAESMVAGFGGQAVYVATAEIRDGEMESRIAMHRDRRGGEWATIEEPLDISSAISRATAQGEAVLVDCLTVWLANLIEAGRNIAEETDTFLQTLSATVCPVVLVSNEVGAGIVPANALARHYADALGTLNQQVADQVGRVVLMAAGQPLLIKPAPTPEIVL